MTSFWLFSLSKTEPGSHFVMLTLVLTGEGLSLWRGLVAPPRFASLRAVFPRHAFLFHTKTACQANYVKIFDIPRSKVDSIFLSQFRDSVCNSVIAEIIGPYQSQEAAIRWDSFPAVFSLYRWLQKHLPLVRFECYWFQFDQTHY